MEKTKKKLTTVQKKNRYRALQYTFFGGEFVSVLTPFIIMGAVNAETWFKSEEGWKVGLGGALALALLGIATLLVTKKKEDKSITNGYITLIVGWFAVAFIFMLLASIMQQITTIMMFGGIGILGAFGLDLASNHYKEKADMYKKAIAKVRGEILEEGIKKEIMKECQDEYNSEERNPVE